MTDTFGTLRIAAIALTVGLVFALIGLLALRWILPDAGALLRIVVAYVAWVVVALTVAVLLRRREAAGATDGGQAADPAGSEAASTGVHSERVDRPDAESPR